VVSRFAVSPVSRPNLFKINAMSNAATQNHVILDPNAPSQTVIVGGGPAGLSTAIMLAKRGWKQITVVERLSSPSRSDDFEVWQDPERSYNIGLNGKGQAALRAIGCWDRIDACCADVVGRMDWTPESDEPKEILLAEKRGYVTKVIQRDRLVSCLYEELQVIDIVRTYLSSEHEVLNGRRNIQTKYKLFSTANASK
jgi:2-polyprenyl-6-methoxyphenol hydroxylase-like FAD-dependent oxidoreductase